MNGHISNLKFNFITEDGEELLTHGEYRQRPELMEKFGLLAVPPAGRRTVFMGTTIVSFDEENLLTDKRRMKIVQDMEREVEQNPLRWFVPQNDDILGFLNDNSSRSLKILTAPNGIGKTVSCWIDVLLDIIDCDKNWDIFKVHGVTHRSYRGQRTLGGVAVVSYEWVNLRDQVWPQVIRRWTPRADLGEWYERTINFRNAPVISIAGTPVAFNACSQSQAPFESVARDIYMWDEQGEEAKFDGANERVRRRNGRHVMGLTPHKVAGRPDTGAGSWIHKIVKREITKGLRISHWTTSIENIFDWVYSEQAKKDAFRQWITEPTEKNDVKRLREGRSRVLGEFHEASGLVFDEWNPAIHIIEPFEIPKSWTRRRAVDHGRVEPCAALMIATAPTGEKFIYDEYYQRDRVASQNAAAIIEKCGNTRVRMGVVGSGEGMQERWYEKQKVRFRRTIMDSRSFSKKTDDSRWQIGQLYAFGGLVCNPADGQKQSIQINRAKELLVIDYDRKHYVTGEAGAPELYVFSNCKNFIREIQGYVNETVARRDRQTGEVLQSEKPRAVNDHCVTAFLFLAMENLDPVPYMEEVDTSDDSEVSDAPELLRDPITGY